MRRSKIVVIDDRQFPNPEGEGSPPIQQSAGRDKGKVFVITEMPATVADEWLTQFGYLFARALREFPQADVGTVKLINGHVLKDPSLRGWRDCVKYRHALGHPEQVIHWDLETCQIEEVSTINFLLAEVYEMHTGFFSPESPSTTDSHSTTTEPSGSLSTQTSRRPSARSSPQGGPR